MTEEDLLAAWQAGIEAGVEAKRLARIGAHVTLWSQEPLQSDLAFRPYAGKLNCAARVKDTKRRDHSPRPRAKRRVTKTNNSWTEEMIERFKAMWPTTSANVIAEALGVTRAAVLGKAMRLELRSPRVKPISNDPNRLRKLAGSRRRVPGRA